MARIYQKQLIRSTVEKKSTAEDAEVTEAGKLRSPKRNYSFLRVSRLSDLSVLSGKKI